jgi:hypothetical protein
MQIIAPRGVHHNNEYFNIFLPKVIIFPKNKLRIQADKRTGG